MADVNEKAVVASFHEEYEMFRHFSNAQRQMFSFFITIYFASGYILTTSNAGKWSLELLIIGLVVGLLFSVMLISNRVYMIKTLRRIVELRKSTPFSSQKQPQSDQGSSEDSTVHTRNQSSIKVFTWLSAFAARMYIIIVGNTFLFYKVVSHEKVSFGITCNLVAILLFLIVHVIAAYLLATFTDKKVIYNH